MSAPPLGRGTGNSTTYNSANNKYASRFLASQTFSTSSGWIAWAVTHATCKSKFVVYADNAGEPGALIASSNERVGVAGAILEYTFGSPVSIVSGTYYWLGWIIDIGTVSLRAQSSTGTNRYNADAYADGAANPFGSATPYTMEACCFLEVPPGLGRAWGDGTTYVGANVKYAAKFTAGANFTSNGAVARWFTSNGSCKSKIVLYADSAGSPGALIATSLEQVGTNGGANVAYTFSSPVSIVAGISYWLGWIIDTTLIYIDSLTIGSACYNADTYADGAANPFGSVTAQTAEPAIYLVAGGGGGGTRPAICVIT